MKCLEIHTTSHLDVFFVFQERCLHQVSKQEVFRLHIKCVASYLSNAVPVSSLHSLVGHHLQQWTSFVKVINGFAQIKEGLPLFQSLGQLATSSEEKTDDEIM